MSHSSDRPGGRGYAILAAAAAIHVLPTLGHAQSVARPARPVADAQAAATSVTIAASGTRARIIGVLDGAPVYADSIGGFFTVDRKIGTAMALSPEAVARLNVAHKESIRPGRSSAAARGVGAGKAGGEIRFPEERARDRVEIIGTDRAGHTLHRNTRGEVFHLDPATGDMIFVRN